MTYSKLDYKPYALGAVLVVCGIGFILAMCWHAHGAAIAWAIVYAATIIGYVGGQMATALDLFVHRPLVDIADARLSGASMITGAIRGVAQRLPEIP